MSMPALGTQASYHAVLTSFTMNFGVVPNGMAGGAVAFGSIGEPQAGLQPLINIDGTPEETGLIAGFPKVDASVESGSCRFLRDWSHIQSMLDAPLRPLVYGMDIGAEGSEQRLPVEFTPRDDKNSEGVAEGCTTVEPELGPFELLSIRQALEMFAGGAAPVETMREIGGYLYLRGRGEASFSLAAKLFFASGVMLLKAGNKRTALQGLEASAANLPNGHESGRAMLYEMAAAAMDDDSGRRSVARQWLRAIIADRDASTQGIKLFRAMWNAWRAGDLPTMGELMYIYMVSMRERGNSLEEARACARMAWLSSEQVERSGGRGDPARERMSSRTQLDVASSLFKRAGDLESAARALRIADMAEA